MVRFYLFYVLDLYSSNSRKNLETWGLALALLYCSAGTLTYHSFKEVFPR